jgi:toxin CcdB
MTQFTAHRNRNDATKSRFPLLLDVQTDLLAGLATRVVVPLAPASAKGRSATLKTLTPIVRVDGKDYVALIPQLAGIVARELGEPVADLSAQRPAILEALDLLFTGI